MRSLEESPGRSEHGYAHRLVGATTLPAATFLLLVLAACTSRPPASPAASGTPSTAKASSPEAEAPATADSAPTPDDAIADLQKIDPGSPEALNDHLEYADRLVSARDADCQSRLINAQSELDAASGDPVLSVVLPLGMARQADLRYRIHAARASCKALAPQRETELQEALAAAQQAVSLFRDALDYESMAVAQFNVAVTERLLGDNGASLASLEAALALDKEFGLHQDAADNAMLLARWRGEPATAPIADFPVRTVTLKSWQPADAQVSVQIDETSIINGKVIRGRAHRTFEQHVQRHSGDWVVSYEPGGVGYDVAQWPQENSDISDLVRSFERALLMPTVRVDSKGNFERVTRLQNFSAEQLAAAHALMLDHVSNAHLGSRDLELIANAFHPLTVKSLAAEDYNLHAGMWIGATLEQGVWYQLAAPLTLPGARQLQLANDIEFAYTRDVPCTGAATHRSCVEIVVHAKPQPAAVTELIESFYYPFVKSENDRMHYWSATYIRMVTDPETLATRVYDVRSYWHSSDRKATHEGTNDRSERIVSTFTYPAP